MPPGSRPRPTFCSTGHIADATLADIAITLAATLL
jgi:hypothetical protein